MSESTHIGTPLRSGNVAHGGGAIIASAVIASKPTTLVSVNMWGDGTNAVEVILYDNATGATAPVLYHGKCVNTASVFDLVNVVAVNGIYAAVTQAGTAGCIINVL